MDVYYGYFTQVSSEGTFLCPDRTIAEKIILPSTLEEATTFPM